MINYLKSEIYRMSQMKSTYLLPIGLSLLLLVMVLLVVLNPVPDRDNSELLFFTVQNMLFVVPLQIPLIVQTIFSDEHGNGTFKNSVSYGVNRQTLYIGKMILSIIFPLMFFAIALGVFLLTSNLLIDINATEQLAFLTNIMKSTPVLIALLFFAQMLTFVVKKISLQWGVFFALLLALPGMLLWVGNVTGITFLGTIFNFTPLGLLMQNSMVVITGETAPWSHLLIVMVIYAGLSAIIGLMSFSKQDI